MFTIRRNDRSRSTGIPKSNDGLRPESYETYQQIQKDNIVLRLIDLQNDKRSIRVGQAKERGIITSAYVALDTEQWACPRYAFYVLLVLDQLKVFYGLGSGMRQSIKFSDLGKVPLAVPSEVEQFAIAAYLDAETKRIDELIEDKGKLLEHLSELRTRAIYEAVYVEADGWKRSRLKFVSDGIIDTEHKTCPYFDDGQYMVVRTTNIKSGKLMFDEAKYTNEEGFRDWTQRALPQPGDVLLTREAPAGEACLVPSDVPLCVGQRTVLIQINREIAHPEFVLWSLYGGLSAQFIADLSRGSTVPHFNMGDIGNIPLFTGPLKEQVARTEKLKKQLDQIDDLTEHAKREIETLKEFRSSTITDAVLGRIDVRKAQAY